MHTFCRLKQTSQRPEARRGAVMVLFSIVLVVLFAMLAFSIDVGRVIMLRSEVQNAVDAGTLAAQLKLQMDPQAVKQAEEEAKKYVWLNAVGSNLVDEDAIGVEVGTWNADTLQFNVGGSAPNAVHVFARQDNQTTSFSKVIGVHTFGAGASAIACNSSAQKRDIMMVLDLSGSMAYQGRIEALRAAAPVFVSVIAEAGGDDQIGVMGLSADPSNFNPQKSGNSSTLYNSGLHPAPNYHVGVMEQPLTDNFTMLKSSVLGPSHLFASKYQGWTGTGAALGDAAHYLTYGGDSRSDSSRYIVLMSDGHANRPPSNGPGYAEQMAAYAASRKITIYTISLGNDADPVLMAKLATIGGGKHFEALGVGAALIPALTSAFEKVAGEIMTTQLVK